jgi:hypothetical protein
MMPGDNNQSHHVSQIENESEGTMFETMSDVQRECILAQPGKYY